MIIYTDGGSRGNPGPAAAGFVIDGRGYGEYLGHATNNVAEYTAIASALKKARALLGKTKAKMTEVEMRMDSELAVKQLTGKYRINNAGIQPLFFEIWNLKFDFKKVDFIHVPREQNKEADAEVNKVLDARG